MDFHIQKLSEDLSLLLHGTDGMFLAADQYCDGHDFLELTEYVEWIGNHGLKARLFARPKIKGSLYRLQVKKAATGSNRRLQRLGALLFEREIPREEINLMFRKEEAARK